MEPSIPCSIADFDALWLSDALVEAGVADAPVTEVHAERIAVGEGFLGELARLHLTYAEGGSGPATAIAKIPTTDGGLKPLGIMLGVYEREARFYEELAPRMEIKVPSVYYNGFDVPGDRYALLMEDVGRYRRGDHLLGADLIEARAVVRAAAGIHAAWWDNADLAAMTWVPPIDSPLNMMLPALYEASWPAVQERYGHLYPAELKRTISRFIPMVGDYLVNMADISRTLTHNDFRLDNLFFDDPEAGGEPGVVVLDFQVVGRGDGSGDLAPFLGCNLDIDLRRAHEDELVHLYHDTMRAAGAGFEYFDDQVRMVDTAHLFWLVNWGNNAATADQPNQRATDLFERVLQRSVAAVLDRESARYIDDLDWRPR